MTMKEPRREPEDCRSWKNERWMSQIERQEVTEAGRKVEDGEPRREPGGGQRLEERLQMEEP
jgi:hypothetical protein